jgi:hypothetical protein
VRGDVSELMSLDLGDAACAFVPLTHDPAQARFRRVLFVVDLPRYRRAGGEHAQGGVPGVGFLFTYD